MQTSRRLTKIRNCLGIIDIFILSPHFIGLKIIRQSDTSFFLCSQWLYLDSCSWHHQMLCFRPRDDLPGRHLLLLLLFGISVSSFLFSNYRARSAESESAIFALLCAVCFLSLVCTVNSFLISFAPLSRGYSLEHFTVHPVTSVTHTINKQ